MPELTAKVGELGDNKSHDVALVQAMLRLVKNAKGLPYYTGNYDGSYGKNTRDALAAFQVDQKLAAPPTPLIPPVKGMAKAPPTTLAPKVAPTATEKLGLVGPGSVTLQKLASLLPAEYKGLRVMPGTKTVYLEATDAEKNESRNKIAGFQEYEPGFRDKVLKLLDQMYADHKIVLWVTPTGWRRTFADQAKEVNTHAGPGESNHNFGRATDIGFRGFRWVQGNGIIKKDADWLNTLEATDKSKANGFWDVRDALAKKVGLHRLQFERVHLQDFDQSAVSSTNSLVKLLNTVGKTKWAPGYKSDLGHGGALFAVGTAKQIWAGQAMVTKSVLAKSLSAHTKKVVKESDIKQSDLDAMRALLKADFEAADANWLKWVPTP